MPAPVPIQVSYDNVGLLARLATAAGEAENRRYGQNIYERQRGRDMQLLMANQDNQSQYNSARAANELAMAELAQQKATQEQAFALQNAALRRRTGSPTARVDAKKSQIADAIQPLVPLSSGTRSGGYAHISGPQANQQLGPDGQIQVSPTDQPVELLDPVTGQLDFTKFPLSPSYIPPHAGGTVSVDRVPMVTPAIKAQVDYVEALKPRLAPEQYDALRTAAMSGTLKMDQLIDDARGTMAGKTSAAGLNLKDRQLEVQRLRRGLLQLTPFNDPGNKRRVQYEQRIREEEQAIRDFTTGSYAPQLDNSIATPEPDPNGKALTPDLAASFLQQSGGDKEVARQLARNSGYTF